MLRPFLLEVLSFVDSVGLNVVFIGSMLEWFYIRLKSELVLYKHSVVGSPQGDLESLFE